MLIGKLAFIPRLVVLLVTIALFSLPATQVAHADPIPEDPDSSFEVPLTLNLIGNDYPVQASIGVAGDQDGFAFTPVAGATYVVELFNVSASLGQGTGDYHNCGNSSSYRGLALITYDTGTNSVIATQCAANGNGNVLTSLTFTAATNSLHKFRVGAHVQSVIGTYGFRILPKYDQQGASWDVETFEPNNSEANAYEVQIGYQHAITTTIEERGSIYATHSGDDDYYRFNAVAGQTYVVELFNVSASLGQGTGDPTNCGDGSFRGLALFARDPSTNSEIVRQCGPNGNGNVLSSIAFEAATTGPKIIWLYGNVDTEFGSYSLRVLPKYGEVGASWDVETFEPNNSEENAYEVQLGYEYAITATIEERESVYTTYTGDNDWYRFNAIAGKTYVVELFNVGASLGQGTGDYCAGYPYAYRGLALYARDATTNSEITRQCEPNGGGNSLVSISFTALTTGPVTLLVHGHVATAFGSYNLRVLPKYDEEGANWNTTTFEPNNREAVAYPILQGTNNRLIGTIEQRNSIYATNSGDVDWYHFQAVQGETYLVELFNVSESLKQAVGEACAGYPWDYGGLALFARDGTTNSDIEGQCEPNGTGSVHSYVEFEAPSTGSMTIQVFPNDPEAFGTYSIRVIGPTPPPVFTDFVFIPNIWRR